MHLPPFHTLGFMVQILYALRSCTTVALYPPITRRADMLPIMPTPQNILDHVQRTKSSGIITIPSIIQAWSQDPKAVDFLKSLEFVVRGLSVAFAIWLFLFFGVGLCWRRRLSKNWRFFIFRWSKIAQLLWINRGWLVF